MCSSKDSRVVVGKDADYMGRVIGVEILPYPPTVSKSLRGIFLIKFNLKGLLTSIKVRIC